MPPLAKFQCSSRTQLAFVELAPHLVRRFLQPIFDADIAAHDRLDATGQDGAGLYPASSKVYVGNILQNVFPERIDFLPPAAVNWRYVEFRHRRFLRAQGAMGHFV